jgi:hypothetical protein
MTDRITQADYRKLRLAKPGGVKRDYKAIFLHQLDLAGLPQPDREVYFALPRKWRADFCFRREMIIVEYQGIFGGPNASHASLAGLKRDYEKFTEASLLGYTLILITAESVNDGRAIAWVEQALKDKLTNSLPCPNYNLRP